MRMPSGPIAPATYAWPPAAALRQPRAFDVDVAQPVGQAEAAQLDAVGAEGVRLDDIRPGADVVLVHLGDRLGSVEVQRIEAAVDEDALRIEHRPHRAVADEHTLVDGFEKWLHSETENRRPTIGRDVVPS